MYKSRVRTYVERIERERKNFREGEPPMTIRETVGFDEAKRESTQSRSDDVTRIR